MSHLGKVCLGTAWKHDELSRTENLQRPLDYGTQTMVPIVNNVTAILRLEELSRHCSYPRALYEIRTSGYYS